MRIDIATLFTDMCRRVTEESIVGRAIKNGFIEINCHDIREYTLDRHRRVDDSPYGGGKGMIMQADPIYRCYSAVCEMIGEKPYVIYMSPQGNVFNQKRAIEFSKKQNLFILCGHYEGIDERIIEEIVDEEISVGDYVLTGGELPALMVADAVARLCPGVLSGDECFENESHYNGLLEYPQYTRPPVWHDKEVPDVLLSGHHANILKWQREKSIERTLNKRPDMIETAPLSKDDIKTLSKIREKREK